MNRTMDENMGCGLWNIHQRLLLYNEDGNGLSFAPSELGGLKVVLRFRVQEEKSLNKHKHSEGSE